MPWRATGSWGSVSETRGGGSGADGRPARPGRQGQHVVSGGPHTGGIRGPIAYRASRRRRRWRKRAQRPAHFDLGEHWRASTERFKEEHWRNMEATFDSVGTNGAGMKRWMRMGSDREPDGWETVKMRFDHSGGGGVCGVGDGSRGGSGRAGELAGAGGRRGSGDGEGILVVVSSGAVESFLKRTRHPSPFGLRMTSAWWGVSPLHAWRARSIAPTRPEPDKAKAASFHLTGRLAEI